MERLHSRAMADRQPRHSLALLLVLAWTPREISILPTQATIGSVKCRFPAGSSVLWPATEPWRQAATAARPRALRFSVHAALSGTEWAMCTSLKILVIRFGKSTPPGSSQRLQGPEPPASPE